MSLWILVGSILGGLLLLALIIFCLWKVRWGRGGALFYIPLLPPSSPSILFSPPARLLHPQETPQGGGGGRAGDAVRAGGAPGAQHRGLGDHQGLGTLPPPNLGSILAEGDASTGAGLCWHRDAATRGREKEEGAPQVSPEGSWRWGKGGSSGWEGAAPPIKLSSAEVLNAGTRDAGACSTRDAGARGTRDAGARGTRDAGVLVPKPSPLCPGV